ncbi:NADH-quinone oxidoreductase subunit N [Terrabacter sp. NPDC000476]|uniref:NADH-quinone oxidoreductase subunit N n=1 Tax=Terrabacter sp. NPDC000476 TaxID=3154258 RepID=UPI003330312B
MEMSMRPLVLAPEMALFAGALVVLLSGSFLRRSRLSATRSVAALALAASAALTVLGMTRGTQTAFDDTFVADHATAVVRVVVAVVVSLMLLVAADDVGGSPREAETYALLLLASTGVLVMSGARDLQVLLVGFLLASIPAYGLVGLERTRAAAEAAMKTYLLGALAGISLMLGTALLYGVSGETSYVSLTRELAASPSGVLSAGAVLVVCALLFEAGAVPAHFWVPDAAQAAGVTAATFLTTVPKLGAVLALSRFVGVLPATVAWPLLVGVLATLTMTLGNLAAYGQTDVRRLLGWSTVSQAGYLLVPVAVVGRSPLAEPSLLFYLGAYAVTNVGAFAVAAALPEHRGLTDYRGLARQRPWLAGSLVVCLLGLVGTPPTAVFIGKLTTATAAWEGGLPWLTGAVVLNSLLSLFYYLRWIVPVFGLGSSAGQPFVARTAYGRGARGAAVTVGLLSLLLGVGAGWLWPA